MYRKQIAGKWKNDNRVLDKERLKAKITNKLGTEQMEASWWLGKRS